MMERKRCKHFSGMMDKVCRAGVTYRDVADKDARPFRVPCLDPEMNCDKREYPTPEEEAENNRQMEINSTWAVTVILEAERSKKTNGKIPCPAPGCGGQIIFQRASNNGHVWAKCTTCQRSMIE